MKSDLDREQVCTSSDGRFEFRVPGERVEQDEEWVAVRNGNAWRNLRIHDYRSIFATPGLYEALVYDVLQCRSPRRLVELFCQVISNWSTEPADLRVIDLGAGNGIVGERLRDVGVGRVLGVDILPEAAAAAERDRPGVYDDYIVADLCSPEPQHLERIQRHRPNTLLTVAALGFGDIPTPAFRRAFNMIETPGWLALTIKEEFLRTTDDTGFGDLLRRMITQGIVSDEARLRIRHRVSLSGEPLFYLALVGRKLKDIPQDWAD